MTTAEIVLVGGNIIAAIIAAGGVILAAWIAKQGIESYREQRRIDGENYRHQREIDRREEIVKRQREEYEKYFEAFWDAQRYVGTDLHAEAVRRLDTARDNLFFYASDEGIVRLLDHHKYIVTHPTSEDRTQEQVETLYALMIVALRKDCFGDTKLTVEDIKSRLTIVA